LADATEITMAEYAALAESGLAPANQACYIMYRRMRVIFVRIFIN
jgi:hypothetical protein